jgi:hypothetical protein
MSFNGLEISSIAGVKSGKHRGSRRRDFEAVDPPTKGARPDLIPDLVIARRSLPGAHDGRHTTGIRIQSDARARFLPSGAFSAALGVGNTRLAITRQCCGFEVGGYIGNRSTRRVLKFFWPGQLLGDFWQEEFRKRGCCPGFGATTLGRGAGGASTPGQMPRPRRDMRPLASPVLPRQRNVRLTR